MKKSFFLPAVLAGLLIWSWQASAQTYQVPVDRWKAQDLVDPEPPGSVLFCGSSSIRRWEDLRKDLADYMVIQRGIGGSKLSDMLYHINEIILPYQPRAVVMWSGINDLIDATAPATGEQVRDRFLQVATAIHASQPNVDLFWIGIPRSPALEGDVAKTAERLSANALIASHIATSGNPHLHYVDMPAEFQSLSTSELNALYVDTLHLNRDAYRNLWVPIIRNALVSAGVLPNRDFIKNSSTLPAGGRLLFDFGPNDFTNGSNTGSPDTAGHFWNNWVGGSGSGNVNSGEHVSRLKDVLGNDTGIGLVITGGFLMNGKANGGLLAPNPALLGDLGINSATEDYFYSTADGLPSGGSDDTPGSFLLEGLDPNMLYDFKFFGSRTTSNTDNRSTIYSVSGANASNSTLQTSGNNIGSNGSYDGNDDAVASVRGIKPNAFGEVFIDITAAQMSASGSTTFAYLNAMEMTAVSAYEGWARTRGLTPGVNDGIGQVASGGKTNLEHFAMDTDPLNSVGSGEKQLVEITEDGGQNYLSLTFPVRRGAVFTGVSPVSSPVSGIVYQVLGDDNLSGANLEVEEVPLASAPPPAGDYDGDGVPDYEYRTFRLKQPLSSLRTGFLWIKMSLP